MNERKGVEGLKKGKEERKRRMMIGWTKRKEYWT
jgi:hypothetical protein